jgi:hypothetical protein
VRDEWKNNEKRLMDMKARVGSNNPNWGGKFPGVLIYDLEGMLLGDFDHLQEASDLVGFTKSYIRVCAAGKKKSKGYIIKIRE